MTLQKNVSLREFNTLGVESIASEYFPVYSAEDLAQVPSLVAQTELPVLVLGGGSNLVLGSRLEYLVLHVRIQGVEFLEQEGEQALVRAEAGVIWHQLVLETIERGWGGLENLSLIPGTVGAAPVQNIGAYGVELADCFHELEALNLMTGESRRFDSAAAQFGYRESVFKRSEFGEWLITSVTLKLSRKAEFDLSYGGLARHLEAQGGQLTPKRISDAVCQVRQQKLPDPAELGNVGSFFKNPVVDQPTLRALQERFPEIPFYALSNDGNVKLPAAWLIEQAGFKGCRRGAIGVSAEHALVLVNYGPGTGADVLGLAREIVSAVQAVFHLELEPEPTILVH